MTTVLSKIAPNLAIHTVVAPLTIYGLHQLYPAPNVGFLGIACAVCACTSITITTLGTEYASSLTKQHDRKDSLFYRINSLSCMSLGILLPIFVRYVGQSIGIQVPGYLKTVGYFTLATNASWAVKHIYEILSDAYYSYYPKPTTKQNLF